jgi:hypothetical protein
MTSLQIPTERALSFLRVNERQRKVSRIETEM